jgi:hypothetical protein
LAYILLCRNKPEKKIISTGENMTDRRKIVSSFLIGALFLLGGLTAFLVITPDTVTAHLSEDRGESAQLYSFYIENDERPVMDGYFNSAGGGGNSEWAYAYVRDITLENWNASRTASATILLMNDAEYLYFGMVYKYENSGNNNNWATVFLDEGNGATASYDGDHDDSLTGSPTTPNENAVMCKKSSGSPTITDSCCSNAHRTD